MPSDNVEALSRHPTLRDTDEHSQKPRATDGTGNSRQPRHDSQGRVANGPHAGSELRTVTILSRQVSVH
jgi:hypothetical protein